MLSQRCSDLNRRDRRQGELRRTGQVAMHYSGRSYDGPTPGAAVPGYTGFVPGRYANNIIGSTHAKGARQASPHAFGCHRYHIQTHHS